MPYNPKQYDAAKDFVQTGDDNVTNAEDQLRIRVQNLYEDIYINSTINLKIVLRGSDQSPMLMPSGRKYVDTVNRFLGLNLDYYVEGQGDAGTQELIDSWFANFFKREAVKSKFESSKKWGLVRGDAMLMLYADPNKKPGEKISIAELDPKQVFKIEDENNNLTGYYLVEKVQDFTNPDDPSKEIVKRRKFAKEVNKDGTATGKIISELTFWTIGKWDDRGVSPDKLERIPGGDREELLTLPDTITQLPIYHWPNSLMQNTSWGTSLLAGFETLLYGINQSLSDEDATVVFQGLGMWMTTSGPPVDPNTGEITDWNIGPMQIIEIGADQKFERVTGLSDLSPYQDHMTFMDEKGLSECAGIPEVAIGRVDVATAQSGIALTLQFMPLLASNAERELGQVNTIDQLFHDITTMWLPGYETETFGNAEQMALMSTVCLFDDPMPVDRSAVIQEVILLQQSNLILTTMAIGKIRELGWKYPTTDPNTGEALTDEDIAQMLLDQTSAGASAIDPFANANLGAFDATTGTPPPGPGVDSQGNTPPSQRTVQLGSG